MWYCQDCVQYYDTTIQDIPLKNIKDSRVGTYPEFRRPIQPDMHSLLIIEPTLRKRKSRLHNY